MKLKNYHKQWLVQPAAQVIHMWLVQPVAHKAITASWLFQPGSAGLSEA